MSAPRNTAEEMHGSAAAGMAFVAGAIAGGPNGFSRAIEDQEASGSAQLRASTSLPTSGSEDPDFLVLGFTFGDPAPGDPLFREATLPTGWTKQPGDDPRQTYIVDARGIRRVSIFYKAAYYDRKAHMHLVDAGEAVASAWIYGDDQVLELHPDLTDDELTAAHDSAGEYLDNAVEHPRIYGDRKPRAIELYGATAAAMVDRKIDQRAKKRGRR